MKTYSFTSLMILGLVSSFLLGNIAISKVMAESGIGKDVKPLVI
jgi:hypothetical protein